VHLEENFLHNLVTSRNIDIVVGSFIEQKDLYTVDNAPDYGFSGHTHNGIGHPGNSHSGFYRGCLSDIMLGPFRLPFVTPTQLINANDGNSSLVRTTAPSAFYIEDHHGAQPKSTPHLGCVLCYDYECQNGGHCQDPSNAFNCSCAPGFEGSHCEVCCFYKMFKGQ